MIACDWLTSCDWLTLFDWLTCDWLTCDWLTFCDWLTSWDCMSLPWMEVSGVWCFRPVIQACFLSCFLFAGLVPPGTKLNRNLTSALICHFPLYWWAAYHEGEPCGSDQSGSSGSTELSDAMALTTPPFLLLGKEWILLGFAWLCRCDLIAAKTQR